MPFNPSRTGVAGQNPHGGHFQPGSGAAQQVPVRLAALVWDQDVRLAPRYRLTRLFAQRLDKVKTLLYRKGARWSVSRISAFSAACLRLHQKRGTELTCSAFHDSRPPNR